jgi:hypothetical protein
VWYGVGGFIRQSQLDRSGLLLLKFRRKLDCFRHGLHGGTRFPVNMLWYPRPWYSGGSGVFCLRIFGGGGLSGFRFGLNEIMVVVCFVAVV